MTDSGGVNIVVGHQFTNVTGTPSGTGATVPGMSTTIDMSKHHGTHTSAQAAPTASPAPPPACPAAPPAPPACHPAPQKCPMGMMAKDAGVTMMSQKTFEYGTLFITKPGHYALCEDVVFDYIPPSRQLKNGFIDPEFTGNAESARANIGIAICCDNVTIDGRGFSMQQSARASTHNRIFTAIECSGINLTSVHGKPRTCPVLTDQSNPLDQNGSRYYGNNNASFGGGGPQETNPEDTHEFYDDMDNAAKDKLLEQYQKMVGDFADVGCENITIKNLTMGRSSHFGIHGTDNRGLYIQDCKFFEFEVAAIWLNNPIRPVLQRLDIVGMQEFPQTLSQLGAFRTQGTGLKGIVNASYWGVIFNQNFGGVGIVFPQPSGGTLHDFESGKSTQKQDRKNPVVGVATSGGLNKQNIGGRNALVEDVNIAQLQSQMITGVVLARVKKPLNPDDSAEKPRAVPILFSNSTTAPVGGGGHGGYTAKDRLIIEAVDDFEAFYDNDVCARWYVCSKFGAPVNPEVLETDTNFSLYKELFVNDKYDFFAGDATVVIDGTPLYPTTAVADASSLDSKLPLLTVYMDTRKSPDFKEENKLRLADRAIMWKKDSADNYTVGKPVHNEYHQGLVQYRGLDDDKELVTDSDKFVYVWSNNYDASGMINRPYDKEKVKDFSVPADLASGETYDHNGKYFSALDQLANGQYLNPIERAAVVVPVINDMIRNHCGPNTGEPWWVSRNMDYQNAKGMPVDFGGHEMNGVVSMHFDRMWGCILRNCNIVNARNLKDPYYMLNTHNALNMATYKPQLGFSASVWGIMMNDSGGNIVQECNTLNMIARSGVSFAMHNAFGSRGNLWENCRAMSCAGGAMWGFVADKGASGNIFRKCETSNIVGSTAAAGFVVRGAGNLLEDCKALDTTVILRDYTHDVNNFQLATVAKFQKMKDNDELVVAGFLLDTGGADEHEHESRTLGYNVLRKCEVLKVGLESEYNADRNAILLHKNMLNSGTDDEKETEKALLESFLDGLEPNLPLTDAQKRVFQRDTLSRHLFAQHYKVHATYDTQDNSNTLPSELEEANDAANYVYNRAHKTVAL